MLAFIHVAKTGGRTIELDVFTAAVVSGEIRLAEHRQVGWFRAGEIDGLDWAAADRPVLPALRRAISKPEGHGLADWLTDDALEKFGPAALNALETIATDTD